MKRNLNGEELHCLQAKYRKVKRLLEQALSHRYRLEQAVRAFASRNFTCWCHVKAVKLEQGKGPVILHTEDCDNLYLALYGVERGE